METPATSSRSLTGASDRCSRISSEERPHFLMRDRDSRYGTQFGRWLRQAGAGCCVHRFVRRRRTWPTSRSSGAYDARAWATSSYWASHRCPACYASASSTAIGIGPTRDALSLGSSRHPRGGTITEGRSALYRSRVGPNMSMMCCIDFLPGHSIANGIHGRPSGLRSGVREGNAASGRMRGVQLGVAQAQVGTACSLGDRPPPWEHRGRESSWRSEHIERGERVG